MRWARNQDLISRTGKGFGQKTYLETDDDVPQREAVVSSAGHGGGPQDALRRLQHVTRRRHE